jgi:hypothetical protein
MQMNLRRFQLTKSELKRLQEVRRTALPKVVERIVVVAKGARA